MKLKIVLACALIVGAVIFGSVAFLDTNVEYGDFHTAISSHKKIQVKGEWVKEKKSMFVAEKGEFVFYMKDDNGEIQKVVFEGAMPNNFELATSIVAKGRYQNDYFHATEILTKCPSKYEGDAESLKKSI